MDNPMSKTWRCFHCDEVFRSRKAAWEHFGPDEGCEKLPPACVDPLRTDEKARLTELREAQQFALMCQENANSAEDRSDDLARELDEFKALTKCSSVHELRMKLDSDEGRLAAAKAEGAAARAELARAYRERDASIKELAEQLADLAAAHEEIARRAEDTARMDAVENLKLTVQHRSGITASVHPWMVRGDVGAWTGRSAREVVDAARAGGTR